MVQQVAYTDLEGISDRLDRALSKAGGLPIMVVDGILAGVAICPDEIDEDEWLSKASLLIPEDPDGSYDEPAPAEVVELIRERHAEIEQEMRAGIYNPIYGYSEDEPDGVEWRPWLNGFALTFSLRSDTWKRLTNSRNLDIATATTALLRLWAHGRTDVELPAEAIDSEILANAADLIVKCTDVLSGAKYRKRTQATKEAKVGRNDPCPCGSGAKFKKCCGAA